MEGDSEFLPSSRWNILQFCLICSYTMGISAIWKFPYLVYIHSGLFLVAYYILLIIICIPVTFFQLKLGSIFGCGIVRLFSHYAPSLKGVAVAMLAISFIECIYCNVYLAYAFYYMFAAMRQPYPWTQASNTTQRISSTFLFFGKTGPENYFFNDVLWRSGSIGESKLVPWHLALCLLAVWLLTFALCCRGPQWFGKAVYVTSPLAYILLLVMLIYSHTAIPSAHKSLLQFFSTQPSKSSNGYNHIDENDNILKSELASPLTWIRALEQHVFNIGLWSGLLPTLGAHLGNKKPASNLTWILVLLIHSILPHLGTITIAPFIHALAVKKGLSFESLISEGLRLTFVILPEAFALTKVHPFWAFLFYLFFLLFTIHRQALLVVVIIENVAENCSKYAIIIFKRKEVLAATICIIAFLLGLPHISQGGPYFTILVKTYLMRLLCVIVFLSIPPFVYAYAKLDSLHVPVTTLCLCIWFTFATVAVTCLLVYNNVMFIPDYIGKLNFPAWSLSIGWCLAVFFPLGITIAGFVHALYAAKGTWKQKLSAVMKRSPTPLPRLDEDPNSHINDYKGGVEGGTLKRRQQNRLELQQRKQREENERKNMIAMEDKSDVKPAETEVCLAPCQNGDVASL